jgi:hypothetical protein
VTSYVLSTIGATSAVAITPADNLVVDWGGDSQAAVAHLDVACDSPGSVTLFVGALSGRFGAPPPCPGAGGAGSDPITGGGIHATVGDAAASLSSLARVRRWTSDQRLHVDFSEIADRFAAAGSNHPDLGGPFIVLIGLAQLNTLISGGQVDYMAVQSGSAVVVFAGAENARGVADSPVLLVGKTLADFGAGALN